MRKRMSANTNRPDTAARHRRKYDNTNPIQKFVLDRFHDALASEIRSIQPERTLEFGCGEGFLLERLMQRDIQFPSFVGIDLREDALDEARERCPQYEFLRQDLLTWSRATGSFDLVVASEVLEHLPEPDPFLARLVDLTSNRLLLTVPFEPWFRLANLARGRDILRLGNHPEHVNLWGPRSFTRFVERHARVERAYTVFPFLIVVATSGP
jgi:trans-aconitate methyltransferase